MEARQKIPLRYRYKNLKTELHTAKNKIVSLEQRINKMETTRLWYFWAGFVFGIILIGLIIYLSQK